jgi:hypothetical protein
MLRRFYVTVLLVAWTVSAGWLVTRKILPPLLPGARPEVVSDLQQAERGEPVLEDWFVEQGTERIGESHSYWSQEPDGTVAARTRTTFRDFPLRTVLESFAGPFGSMLPPSLFDQRINFEILSRGFYVEDRLERLTLLVIHDRDQELARFEMTRVEGVEYELVATTRAMTGGRPTEILRRPLSLGESADARGPFSAGPRMLDLRVGQTWTESVAKPFTSGESEVLHVYVAKQELLSWHGVPMRTNVVEYRRNTGVGDAARKPDATVWVDESGETLQQDLRLGSTVFRMVRMPEPEPTGEGGPSSAVREAELEFGEGFDRRFDEEMPAPEDG